MIIAVDDDQGEKEAKRRQEEEEDAEDEKRRVEVAVAPSGVLVAQPRAAPYHRYR